MPPIFVQWVLDLIKFIANCYNDEKIITNRCEFIAVSLQKLRNDGDNFDAFGRVFRATSIAISDADLRKIYLKIAEFAFRSYTKEENNRRFNSVKAIATDKSNIDF